MGEHGMGECHPYTSIIILGSHTKRKLMSKTWRSGGGGGGGRYSNMLKRPRENTEFILYQLLRCQK